jgi:protein-tyrosine phosphatase
VSLAVVFVCWGNICRSPMAERMAEAEASRRGLVDVRFTSAAVSDEELGHPIDARAARVLAARGYRTSDHRAHRITASEIRAADLVVGAEPRHVEMMRALAPEATNLALLTDFDPSAPRGSSLPDPWYGPASGFDRTAAAIEAALPGLFDRLREFRAGSKHADVAG